MRDCVFCQYCGEELGLGARFLHELEAEGVDDRFAPTEVVRSPDPEYGEPLAICDKCRSGIAENKRALAEDETPADAQYRRAVYVLAGMAAVGLVTSGMRWFHRPDPAPPRRLTETPVFAPSRPELPSRRTATPPKSVLWVTPPDAPSPSPPSTR